jgi:hypothetical protein
MSFVREVLHPFPATAKKLPLVKEVKSTLIVSSVQALRERGHYDTYLANLPPDSRDKIVFAVAGVWIPIDWAILHYRATDAIGLSAAQRAEMGTVVGVKIQATVLGTVIRLARSSGVTPWTVLAQFQFLFERIFRGGGGTSIVKLGPKDARIDIIGLPLAAIPHFRSGFRAMIHSGGELFTQRAYVREVPEMCDETSLSFRASWV